MRRCRRSGSKCGRKPRVASTVRPGPKTAADKPPATVDTPVGTAAYHLDRPANSRGLLFLGHGAGGGVDARDLVTARNAATEIGWAVARVVQPYRLAGRRAPAPAAQLDVAWACVVGAVRARRGLTSIPMVFGGRSSGARVACRTARELGAQAVCAFAFPLHPPGRPERSRAEELSGAGVPVVVVQGDRDAFGSAADIDALRLNGVTVHDVVGADHALRGAAATQAVAVTVTDLLSAIS